MEVVQCLQPPHEAIDESDDSHSHFKNPFGVPPRESPCVERNEPSLDYNFKVEILEFQGSLKLEDFVYWLNTVERMFHYYEVMDEKKVRLVTIRLKGDLPLGGNNYKFLANKLVKSRSRIGRR